MAKTVVFDFDGVIHSYTSGWLGETTIPDPPVPGIREALKEIHGAGYEVVVVSTRCATAKGKGAIEAWLYNNGLREYIDSVCRSICGAARRRRTEWNDIRESTTVRTDIISSVVRIAKRLIVATVASWTKLLTASPLTRTRSFLRRKSSK